MRSLHEELAVLSPERRELLERLLARQGLAATVLPIPRRRLQQAPLSYTQERLWQIGRMAERTPLGNVPLAFQVHGSLDVPALGRALNYLVTRHEILRTKFESDGSTARQLVDRDGGIPLRVTDLRNRPAEGRRQHAEQLMHREAARPFAPTGATRFRAELWQLGAEDHIFLLLLHHLVVDGVAIRVLLRELSAAYAAFSRGTTPLFPEPPIHYGDFAVWQRESLRGDALDRLVSFWERELAGSDRAGLANGRSASTPSFRGGSRHFSFSQDFSNQLRSVSRREGVTLFMLMAAALHVLERAYTRSDDVQIGTVISYRTRAETEELIGNLGSSVVLRADLSGDPTLREVLERERRVVMAAQAHQELSLELLIDELQRRGSTTRVPPIRTMLLVRDSSVGDHVAMPGLSISRLPVDLGVTWLDLSVDLVEAREIHGTIEHRLDTFDEAGIDRFIADFQTVLEHLATDPDTRLSTLPTFVLASQAAARPEMAEFVAPRTDVERRMAEIWQRVLNTGPVSVRAEFFELGGHSLLVGQLAHEIEMQFGQSVSPQTVFAHPTIETLTAVLTDSAPPVRVTSSLPLQASKTKPPIFAVHAGDDFDSLARLLDQDQPFWRLTAQGGLDGRRPPYHPAKSVEDLARLYTERVRACSPKGPYFLMGHCFGGLVAFEMARQLEADEVGAVVLVDAFPFNLRNPSANGNGRIRGHVDRLVQMRLPERVRYLQNKTTATLRWQRVRIEIAQQYLAIESACRWHLARGRSVPAELLRKRFVWAATQMLRRYTPQPFAGRVLLLHMQGSSPGAEPWHDLARGGLEAHEFATSHHGMLHSPVVERVSAILREYVTRHRRDRTSSPVSRELIELAALS